MLTLTVGPQGQSSVHAEATTPLWMLFGVTGVVLLSACANIANVLLARGPVARQKWACASPSGRREGSCCRCCSRGRRCSRCSAVLRIPESQAKDVAIGQPATIDTRNGVVSGRVVRKDPAVIQGTVTIDVALEGALPAGAVPDLLVDGTIQIEKLTSVLHTGRPAFSAANGQVGLFKLTPDGDAAVRVPVQLGRTSGNTVEILGGLALGGLALGGLALGGLALGGLALGGLALGDRVAAALERVGMSHRTKHYPPRLSGGQQQRVAVARAVAGDPAILLADEPTGDLDSKNGEAVMELLRELNAAGSTICMVTHDARYASHAGREVQLFDGQVVEAVRVG